MFPITGLLSAGIGALGGLAQVGMGIADRVKGNRKLKEAQDFYSKNKFQIPESAEAALDVAERNAQGFRLPGEDIRRAQIAEATAGGVGAAQNAATSSSDVLGVLSSLYGQQQGAEQNMAIAGAERYDRNQQMLGSELNRMADLEQQKWEFNSLYPYQQMLGQAEAYQTRGAAGIGGGLNTLGETAGAYMNLSSEEQMFQEYLNKMGLGGSTPNNNYIPTTKMNTMGAGRFNPNIDTKTLGR